MIINLRPFTPSLREKCMRIRVSIHFRWISPRGCDRTCHSERAHGGKDKLCISTFTGEQPTLGPWEIKSARPRRTHAAHLCPAGILYDELGDIFGLNSQQKHLAWRQQRVILAPRSAQGPAGLREGGLAGRGRKPGRHSRSFFPERRHSGHLGKELAFSQISHNIKPL